MAEIKFSEEALALAKRHISKYPEGKSKSALLPLLHLAQAELGGQLTPEVMDYVADLLQIKSIEVYEVATFYSMYFLEPVGKVVLEVCRTSPCMLRGSDEIIAYIEKKLGIKDGETTPDGMFTLKTVECLAACGNAPVIQVGLKYHENVDAEKVDSLLATYKEQNKIERAWF